MRYFHKCLARCPAHRCWIKLSFLLLSQSGVVDISKLGLMWELWCGPQPDVVSAQGSLNLDAKTISILAPIQSTQRGLTAPAFHAAMASESPQHLTSSRTSALAMPRINSGQCCYGGQGSENKAIFFPTENRSQKRWYFQTHLIKGLLPLAIRAVVTNMVRFLSNSLFREGTGVPQYKEALRMKIHMYVKSKFKSDSALQKDWFGVWTRD